MKPSNFREIKRMPYIRQGPGARPCVAPKGIDVILQKGIVESRQLNPAVRRCVRVLLTRNGSTRQSFPPE